MHPSRQKCIKSSFVNASSGKSLLHSTPSANGALSKSYNSLPRSKQHTVNQRPNSSMAQPIVQSQQYALISGKFIHSQVILLGHNRQHYQCKRSPHPFRHEHRPVMRKHYDDAKCSGRCKCQLLHLQVRPIHRKHPIMCIPSQQAMNPCTPLSARHLFSNSSAFASRRKYCNSWTPVSNCFYRETSTWTHTKNARRGGRSYGNTCATCCNR